MTDHQRRAHAFRNPSNAQYWMNCDLWGMFKHTAETKAGGEIELSSPAAERGRELHTVAEQAVNWLLVGKHDNDPDKATRAAYKAMKSKIKHAKKEEDLEDCIVAVSAAMDLITPDMQVALEVPVPLSHEPESDGSVDVLGYVEHDLGDGVTLLDYVLIADHKFGEMAVSPNAWQLRLYAMNALSWLNDETGVQVGPATKVKLAIIQPRVHLDPIVRTYTALELIKMQVYVEGHVEAQEKGSRRGAGSLSTCDWCDFRKACTHKAQLAQTTMMNLQSVKGGELTDKIVEDIARDAGAFKTIIKECVDDVKTDPVRFPNWTRAVVSNAEQWSPLVDVTKATKKLKGAKDLYVLNTPKQVRDNNPTLSKKIDGMVSERGSHIRLHEGVPNGAVKTEPQRRAVKSTAKKAAKKAAKKKAAKKASKKKAAKKASKKKTAKRSRKKN